MGRRKIAERFINKACLTTTNSSDLTLESWDAIAHTEAEENCRIYAVKLGQGAMAVTYELKDGKIWPQRKCNVCKIDSMLFKKDPPLREWAAAKLLEYEFKRCTIESQVFAAKRSPTEQMLDHINREGVTYEKQRHDDRCYDAWKDYGNVADRIAAASREFEALSPKVESVISKVDAGRKRCDKLEMELANERAGRGTKLSTLDAALQRTNASAEELSEQNRKLKDEVRRLKADIKEAKKNESGK